MSVCPECGAVLPGDESCHDRYERCLALEFETWTGYGAVHHLSVTAYLLQHPAHYSREGWLESRRQLAEFLVEGKSPSKVREQHRARLDSGRRSWRMVGGEAMALPACVAWSKTIADVRLEDAAVYCAGVTEWAQAVLSDTVAWATRA